MSTLLIDADILSYQYAARNEANYSWDIDGETVVSEVLDAERACAETAEYIDDLMEQTKCEDFRICLSDSSERNWRLDVLPTYKANRKDLKKPKLWRVVRSHLETAYPDRLFIKDRLEADDVMGILATHPRIIPGKKIIASLDKDMYTIPASIYRPAHHGKKPLLHHQDAEGADYYHLLQTLMGDQVDGYTGIPGVGIKKAAKWLDEHGATWESVLAMYETCGLGHGDALVQARVARICRASDYDFKKKEVILWNP